MMNLRCQTSCFRLRWHEKADPVSADLLDKLALASRRQRSLCMRGETSGSGSISATERTEESGFIRPHLRKLAPYTPIEPFEILSKRYISGDKINQKRL